jgi:micrococcal nuclease
MFLYRFILLGFICLLQTALYAQKTQLHGTIIKVVDGDTMDLLDEQQQTHRIRLYGVDCPENGQDFSVVAKRFVSQMILQKVAQVEVLYLDRYKRHVGKLYIDDKELNLTLLQEGLAWHYLAYDQSDEYALAQKSAQSMKKGLWKQPNAQAPWEYRQVKRNKSSPTK